jgi:hypothetical protein
MKINHLAAFILGCTAVLVQQLSVSSLEPPVFVKADVLNVRNSPTGDIVEQITRGDSVVIYQTLSGWVRISPSKAPQRWVLEEYLCSGQSCWVTHSTTPSPPTNSSSYTSPRQPSGYSSCPCSGSTNCVGPRGGRYCITSGGKKKYR